MLEALASVLLGVHILCFGATSYEFAEGVQQGDPHGPLLLCLAMHCYSSQLTSELFGGIHRGHLS